LKIKGVETNMEKKSLLSNGITFMYCLVAFTSIAIPLYMALINSFKPNVHIFGDFISLPQPLDFSNFEHLFRVRNMFQFIRNSIFITTVVTVVSLVINPFIAYKIAMSWDSKFFRTCFYIVSSAMFVPPQTIMFPLIRQYYALGLMNPVGLIVYYAVLIMPQSVFLMVPYFRLFEKKLRNVAYLDGCKEINFYLKIFVPICKPVILSVTILSAIWTWNDFIMPLMILYSNPDAWTLPIFIFSFMGRYSANRGVAFAASQIAIMPLLMFYIFFHKKITRGFSIKNVY